MANIKSTKVRTSDNKWLRTDGGGQAVSANPALVGTEPNLDGLQIGNNKFAIKNKIDNKTLIKETDETLRTSIGGSVEEVIALANNSLITVNPSNPNLYSINDTTAGTSISTGDQMEYELTYNLNKMHTARGTAQLFSLAGGWIATGIQFVDSEGNNREIVGEFYDGAGSPRFFGILFDSTTLAELGTGARITLAKNTNTVEFVDSRAINIDNDTIQRDASGALVVAHGINYRLITQAEIDDILNN